MQILHAAGEEIDWTDSEAMSEAYRDWSGRMDLWDAWQEYRKAHAEWACYELDVRYYGGGHYQLSVGDLYEGDHTDQWGRPTNGPDGYVMIKREDGIDLAKAAESLVDIWNQYLEGDVWFFEVLDENGEQVESCGGCCNIGISDGQGGVIDGWHTSILGSAVLRTRILLSHATPDTLATI